MHAFRTTELIHSDVLTIRLPNDFINRNLEIIVLALEDRDVSIKTKREQFRKKILTAPVWSEEEIDLHLAARKHLEKWNQV